MNKNNLHLLDQNYMKHLNKCKRFVNSHTYMTEIGSISDFESFVDSESDLLQWQFNREQLKMRLAKARPGLRRLLEIFHRMDD